jgi:hypothetical protein
MLILDANTVLDINASVAGNLHISGSVADMDSSGAVTAAPVAMANITSAGITTVVTAPASGYVRQVDTLYILNKGAASNSVTPRLSGIGSPSISSELKTFALAVGESIALDSNGKWTHYNASGSEYSAVDTTTTEWMIRQAAAYTLTSQTASQKLFGIGNGAASLPTGIYEFDALVYITGMSATSGNALISLLGAGTATLVATPLFYTVGIDGAAATAATQTGSTSITTATPASAVTAGTGTAMTANLTGTFEVTVAGTIIPSISLVTAAAAVVAIGSYFKLRRRADTGTTTIGQWS